MPGGEHVGIDDMLADIRKRAAILMGCYGPGEAWIHPSLGYDFEV